MSQGREINMPQRIVSDELAQVAVAAGVDEELARLDLELGLYREHCACEGISTLAEGWGSDPDWLGA